MFFRSTVWWKNIVLQQITRSSNCLQLVILSFLIHILVMLNINHVKICLCWEFHYASHLSCIRYLWVCMYQPPLLSPLTNVLQWKYVIINYISGNINMILYTSNFSKKEILRSSMFFIFSFYLCVLETMISFSKNTS